MAVVSPVFGELIVRCRVTTESQPLMFVNVCVGVPVALYVVPYHVNELHTVAVVSPVFGVLIVRCRVTTESQPLIFVSV